MSESCTASSESCTASSRPRAGKRRLGTRAAVLTLTLGLAATGLSAPATASSQSWPGIVAGVHVASSTSTSFTVALNRASYASQYRVSASTVESDIWLTNINRGSSHRRVTNSSTPRIAVRNLPYTSAAYYFRVATINGPHIRWSSAYQTTHLSPASPTALSLATGSAGTYLSWQSPAATGYSIQQATNSKFTANQRNYTTTNPTRRFTPIGLSKGGHYWFRVRAVNGNVVSGYSAAVAGMPTTSTRRLRMVTYNVLSHTFDGSSKGGTKQAAWSQRRAGAVSLLKRAGADVITVQEAGSIVSTSPHLRQVDSILRGIGTSYALANTDHGSNPGAHQNSSYMGNYILYKRATVAPYGTGGHWMIGPSWNASYHLFRAVGTSARFLFVATHLDSTRGHADDLRRSSEVSNMIRLASAYAHAHGVTSIVYGGDMNSWPGRYLTTDTPGNQMQLHLTMDSIAAARSHYNEQYSSINSYLRTPPKGGSADRIFATGGIGVASWGELLNLSGGKFVGVIPSDHNPVWTDLELPY